MKKIVMMLKDGNKPKKIAKELGVDRLYVKCVKWAMEELALGNDDVKGIAKECNLTKKDIKKIKKALKEDTQDDIDTVDDSSDSVQDDSNTTVSDDNNTDRGSKDSDTKVDTEDSEEYRRLEDILQMRYPNIFKDEYSEIYKNVVDIYGEVTAEAVDDYMAQEDSEDNEEIDADEVKRLSSEDIEQLDDKFDLLPQMRANDKRVALIDADTIIYISALAYESKIDIDNIKPKKVKKLKSKFAYSIEDEDTKELRLMSNEDFESACNKIKEDIEKLRVKTGSGDVELAITPSRDNFRYNIMPEYKMKRGTNPAGLEALKEWVKENYKTHSYNELEADDVVVALKRAYPTKYVLCAIDKDVLGQSKGKALNYYWRDPKWVNYSYADNLYFRFYQALKGDSIDGIKGAKGIGDAGAKKALEPLKEKFASQAEYMETVKQIYLDVALKEKIKSLKNSEKEKAEEEDRRANYAQFKDVKLTKEEELEAVKEFVLNLNLTDMHITTYDKEENEFVVRLWKVTRTGTISKVTPAKAIKVKNNVLL